MEWTAETFIETVLKPQKEGWWTNLGGEVRQSRPAARYLQDTLAATLAEAVQDFRKGDRRLFFFSTSGMSTIDGRAGPVGVEEKCAGLTFREVIDGAIHRAIAWVLGNPQGIDAPEAVSLYVTKAGATPMSQRMSDALAPVLQSLTDLNINVMFIHGETGQFWRAQRAAEVTSMPSWLAVKPTPQARQLSDVQERAIALADRLNNEIGQGQSVVGGALACTEYELDGGGKLALTAWPNEWQMIEIGLLLRGAGYDAAKVIYSGNRPLVSAGRGVERRIQTEMSRLFGVVLDWGVPLES